MITPIKIKRPIQPQTGWAERIMKWVWGLDEKRPIDKELEEKEIAF